VQLALDTEKLVGECPGIVFETACENIDQFMAYSHLLVAATVNSIATRLGLKLRCPCGLPTCTGERQEGCGLDMYDLQADLFNQIAEPEWTRDNARTVDAMLLIDERDTGEATEERVAGWTDDECRAVEDYCYAVHYAASDNDVEVPPRPEVLSR
jgi:murein endopeptidase